MGDMAMAGTVATEAAGALELDALSDAELAGAMLASQAEAVRAVERAAPAIMTAVGAALPILRAPGSRLIYCGAGTSGRVALLDAVELWPTFSWPNERARVVLAGGEEALFQAREGAEDDEGAARRAIEANGTGARDVVLGLAASGTTPFVLAAIHAARARGAVTIGLASNPGAPLLSAAAHPILLDSGPEALAGSTRLAAGTAQKIALNLFSTAVMTRLGRVHRGRMVDMRVTNEKLRARAVRIVAELVPCDEPTARAALSATGQRIKPAVLVACGATPEEAEGALERAGGQLGPARAGMRIVEGSRPS